MRSQLRTIWATEDADLRVPLGRLNSAYPDTFTFAVDGLIGASPETLVQSSRGAVTARVLAGFLDRGTRDVALVVHAPRIGVVVAGSSPPRLRASSEIMGNRDA